MPEKWNDLTPQEAVDRLNQGSPHMNARLGRKGDSELSETLIHSVPESTTSKKDTQPGRSGRSLSPSAGQRIMHELNEKGLKEMLSSRRQSPSEAPSATASQATPTEKGIK